MPHPQRRAADELDGGVHQFADGLGGEHLAGDAFVDDVLAGLGETRGAVHHAARGKGADAHVRIAQPNPLAGAERRAAAMRRFEVAGDEIDHPAGEAHAFGGKGEAGVADLPHGAGQSLAGLADDVARRHGHVVELHVGVVGAVHGAEGGGDVHSGRFAVDDDHGGATALHFHQRVDEVGFRTAGDVGLLAVDDEHLAVKTSPRGALGLVRLREAKGAAAFAGQHGFEIAFPCGPLRAAEHAGPGPEHAAKMAQVVRTQGVPHHRHRQRPGCGTAELHRLRHAKDAGRLRRFPHQLASRRRLQRLVLGEGDEGVPRQGIHTITQGDQFRG